MRRSRWLVLGTCAGSLAVTTATDGGLVDFEGFANGTAVGVGSGHTLDYQPYPGIFTLTAISNGSPNLGASIFDSSLGGPNAGLADQDLLVGLGGILIVQNDAYDEQSTPGIFDVANDEEDGGTLIFEFNTPVELLSIDLIDIDGNGPVDIILEDGGGRTRTFNVGPDWTFDVFADGPNGWDTLDLTTLAAQAGEGGGLATAFEDPLFDSTDVVFLTVIQSGSAGIDNISFVPGPSALLALAGGLLINRRRRR